MLLLLFLWQYCNKFHYCPSALFSLGFGDVDYENILAQNSALLFGGGEASMAGAGAGVGGQASGFVEPSVEVDLHSQYYHPGPFRGVRTGNMISSNNC